jgi:uncharacterized protein YcbK (DUF882 family)
VSHPFARVLRLSTRSVRVGYRGGLAALLVLFGCESLQNAVAEGDTRTISFHHTHTGEDLTITYKVNGRYDEDALTKINQELRDWREDKSTKMDPHVIDLLWDVHRELSAKEPIWIICGFRSPSTNSMLRRRSSGVAKNSQHMLGKAIDFYIPGVALEDLRAAGLRAQRGGVGFYPSSNFVHLDTGSVRHWGPHISDVQMAKIMAKGPLTRVAGNDQPVKATFKFPKALAKMFGGGRDRDEEEDAETVANQPAAGSTARPAAARQTATAEAKSDRPITVAAVPLPPVKPAAKPAPGKPATFEMASASSRTVELRPAQAASLVGRADSANSIISERGFWHGTIEPEPPQASAATKSTVPAKRPAGTAVAAADAVAFGGLAPWPMPERGTTGALAYAPATTSVTTAPVTTASIPARPAAAPTTPARAAAPTTPLAAPVPVVPVDPETTVAVKRSAGRPTLVSSPSATGFGAAHVKPGEIFNNPWMRAMVLAPSAQRFMSTSLFGAPDFRNLGVFMQKPQASVMMTFSSDPHLGMTAEHFSGYAVVFVSTVTFNQRTAALQ